MIHATSNLRIPEDELQWSFVPSGGPGGQNVNKVASKAVLRWNVDASPSVPEPIKSRLREQQRRRITAEGDLIVSSQRFREQERNRRDCLEKLVQLLREAAKRPPPRKPTRPTRAAKERRLQAKRHRARRKAERRKATEE